MKPWFDTTERVAALLMYATSWIGTRFAPNSCLKGRGVSCQKLAGSLYKECGFLGMDVDIPEGPMDWSNNHKDSLIVAWVSSRREFADVTGQKPQAGDLVGFRLGSCVQHMGVMVDGQYFVHVTRGTATELADIRQPTFANRLEKLWRPIEL